MPARTLPHLRSAWRVAIVLTSTALAAPAMAAADDTTSGAAEVPSEGLGSLPPPPRHARALPAMRLRLELVINEAPTGTVVGVEQDGPRFLVDAADLRGVNIALAHGISGRIDVAALPGVSATYRQDTQQLMLTVPSDWLPMQALFRDPTRERQVPQSSFGAVLNYDLYVSRDDGGRARAALWNDARVFGDFGVLRSTGVYNQPLSGGGKARFTRFDTRWAMVDDERALTYEAGDLITRTLPWAGSARLGGVQLSRDFSVRPDIVTYPLPSFKGSAAVPSSVDLFVNGNHTASGDVDPGPFTLGDVPYVTGAGEAVVVTTDAQGRRVTTSTPFYVASTLLRPGLSDFAFAAGALRRDYGRRNFAYGALAASAALRHGLTNWLTVEAQAQASRSLALAGGGAAIRIGNLGVIDLSGAVSRHAGETDAQIEVGYQYSSRRFNLSARHIRRERGYTDLGTYGFAGARLARAETQINANLVLPDDLGTLGSSYIATDRGADDFRLINLTYAKPLWRSGTMLLSVNRELERERTTALLQLVVSLGRDGTVVGGLERDALGSWRQSLGYARAVPSDGGLGWRANLAHSARLGDQYTTALDWRTPFAQFQAGAYGGRGGHTQWADVSGSLVLMGGKAFASNRISDAFVLVSTDGVGGIPVFHENQRVGMTGRSGFLLVPSVPAYQGAKFAIDPLDLPAEVTTPVVELYAAVTLGGGRFVHFPVRKATAAIITLQDREGRPLKAGTPLVTDNGTAARVGWDGEAYVEDFAQAGRVTATLADGSTCAARLPATVEDGRTGPLTCE